MSYFMGFWKTTSKMKQRDSEIFQLLSCGSVVNNVEYLPTNEIKEQFDNVFRKWKKNDTFYEKGNERFLVTITDQFVMVACDDVMSENLNAIIDIMNGFGCPLYDTTFDMRFEI